MGFVKKFVISCLPYSFAIEQFVCSYAQLVGVRICLGVTEAGLFPGVTFL